jgi:hypothetical protein
VSYLEVISTLEIRFLFFTPQGGAEKSQKEFREDSYPPCGGLVRLVIAVRGIFL